ncbi:autotransporter outer membrane beta-barrel domain-containing protein [uncultured Sutterella sp.]|uniref:autotransporter family protein n=1 Tax=uncultured Sutterella sp. TaxID=286133 RepID=UPI00266EC899|nr:autotransporter outer membrane beta-barrel domain-containing protein [uncultured Sutterella sp.]
MSNATFSRKPLVAAVLTTLAVFSAGAMAGETEEAKTNVELTIGTAESTTDKTVAGTVQNEQTWDEAWAKKFNDKFTNASGTVTIGEGTDASHKTITIGKGTDDKTAGKLTNNLSSLTLNVGLNVAEGGTFVNNGTLEANKAITVTGSLVNTGTLKTNETLTIKGGFDNAKGKIEATKDVTINGLDKTTDLEAAPASVVMGDITLKHATLTNNDKGYTLKTEAEKKEGEADKKPENRVRVTYGKVTLNEGGNFVNNEGALDSGSSLTITKDAGTAKINGTSTWGTINAQKGGVVTVGDKGTLSADYLEYGYDADNTAKISDLVSVTGGGKFTVNKGLIVSSFANGGSFDLSEAEYKYLDSGASLTFGKAQAFKQVDDDKDTNNGKIVADGDYHKGTVTLSGYEAEWKAEATTPKTGTEGNADTENQGSWDVTKFGAVTVYNNAQLTISDNKAKTADDLTKHGYSASLSLGSLTLNSTSLKVTPSVKVATLTGFIEKALKKVNDGVADDKTVTVDTSKWTKDDYAKNLENFLGTLTDDQKKKFTASYDESIKTETDKLAIKNITATDATQTITGSDVAIGSITFATVERSIEADTSKVVTSREGEGAGDNTPADRGSVTVDAITQAMGTQTLKIEGNSRVEVGSLSLGNGTLNIKGSDVIIHKTDKINGTLTAESGYLGINVATTMADKVKADTPSTTGTTPNFVLEVGAPVVFGEDAKVTFGGPATNTTAGTDADKVGAELTFAGATTLKFDAANFNRNALFTAEGTKGKIDATGTINLEGSNLTWGAYKLFENFDQSGIAKEELTFTDGKLTAADAWKNQVGNNFEIKQNSDGDWMIVAGGTSVEGSGLNVSAKNLVSKIFAGERSTGPDTQLINQILSTGASLQEISSMINSVTGLGAISGVKAMTVDFQGYTADMIEHHAATMPKEMGGWWVQPMGARLKTDDLSMGGSAYGYSLDTYGIMGGFDTHLKNGWTIGAAASYQSGDADGEGDVLPVSTDVKNVGLHLWGSRMYGETNVIGTLSYVTTDGDVTMQLGNLELASELKAKALSAGIRAEREFKTGAFTLTPHAGARLSIVDMDDYEIAAGTTKLFDVSEDKATIFEVPVGMTVQTPSFMFQTFEVKPYVDVTLRGRFGDTESSYTLEGSSTTDTIDYDVSGSFVGDLKVGYMSTYKNLNLGMSYGLSAGDAGRQNHAIEATMRVDF